MVSVIGRSGIKMLPCPFCGACGPRIEGDSEPGCWGVECSNPDCEASGPRGCASPDAAAMAWNSRLTADHPRLTEPEESRSTTPSCAADR